MGVLNYEEFFPDFTGSAIPYSIIQFEPIPESEFESRLGTVNELNWLSVFSRSHPLQPGDTTREVMAEVKREHIAPGGEHDEIYFRTHYQVPGTQYAEEFLENRENIPAGDIFSASDITRITLERRKTNPLGQVIEKETIRAFPSPEGPIVEAYYYNKGRVSEYYDEVTSSLPGRTMLFPEEAFDRIVDFIDFAYENIFPE